MKNKLKIMSLVAAMAASASAYSQTTAGSLVLSTGWFHIAPQVSSDPIKTTNIGGRAVNISQAGTSSTIKTANTLGLSATYFITDHIAGEIVAGIPPKFTLTGTGTLSRYGDIGTVKQWSPAALLKYYFLSPQSKFRPFVGLGVSYIWFTDAKITNGQFMNSHLGGPTKVKVDSAWSPVFNAGFSYEIAKNWYAGLSVSYLPFSTKAKLDTASSNRAGGLPVRSEANIRINPIVTYLNIGYRF